MFPITYAMTGSDVYDAEKRCGDFATGKRWKSVQQLVTAFPFPRVSSVHPVLLGHFSPPREKLAQSQPHHCPTVPRLLQLLADLRGDFVQGIKMLILKQQRDLHQTMMFMPLVPLFVMLVRMIVFVTHGTLPTYTTIGRVVHKTKAGSM
ncbi:MAG: hypothetical protein ACM30F_04190 [Nitrospirota bacterium]